MIKHYVLHYNPQAEYEWDRWVLRNPLTGERLDVNKAIAESIDIEAGSYLLGVNIQVQILEQKPDTQASQKIIELPNESNPITVNKLLVSQNS